MRLAETPSIPIAEPTGWLSFLQFTKDDAMRGIELGVMALLGLLVLFFGVRPLLRRVMGTDQAALAAGGVFLPGATVVTAAGAAASGGPGVLPTTGVNVKGTGHGSITSTGGPNVALVGGDAHVNISNRTSAMIDIAQVQGQVHAESVKKVGELAERTREDDARERRPASRSSWYIAVWWTRSARSPSAFELPRAEVNQVLVADDRQRRVVGRDVHDQPVSRGRRRARGQRGVDQVQGRQIDEPRASRRRRRTPSCSSR